MLNIVIFGAPGSGKGTQSERISGHYGLHHISTGDLLRKHIADDTELGRTANQYISQGHLIPDDLMIQVLEDLLDNNPELTANGVIFDGFPRTIEQARSLDEMLHRRGSQVDKVVGLEVNEDDLIQRMLQRGKECGRADDHLDTIKERLNVYHSQTTPLRDYYIKAGKYKSVDGNSAVEEVFESIKKIIDE